MSDVKTTNPLVSIIVRTKDRPKLLENAIRSIANQTYRPIEVVLVNDGGCDLDIETLKKILDDILLNYQRLETNTGRAHAGNVGIDNARGEYIGFLDDDDEFYPEHVETLISNLLINSEYSVVYADTELSYKEFLPEKDELIEKERRLFGSKDFSLPDLLVGNYIPLISLLFRKQILTTTAGFDENFDLYEDWDLLIRCAAIKPFLHIKKVTSLYVQWNEAVQINANKDIMVDAYHQTISKNASLSLRELCRRFLEEIRINHERHQAIIGLRRVIDEKDKVIQEKDKVIQGKTGSIIKKDQDIEQLKNIIRQKDDEIIKQNNIIFMIENSLGWQMLNILNRQKEKFFPEGTKRRVFVNKGIKATKILLKEGVSALIKKIKEKRTPPQIQSSNDYEKWINTIESKQRLKSHDIKIKPSFVFIVYSASENNKLHNTLESIKKQDYKNIEIHITPQAKLNNIETKSTDIITKINTNQHLNNYLRDLIKTNTSDFFVFIKSGDTLSPSAIKEVLITVNNRNSADFIYSDEDCLQNGKRSKPFFKPQWSPDLLRSYNYIGNFFVVRRSILEEIDFDEPLINGCEIYDLSLRLTEKAEDIVHIPKILYHKSCVRADKKTPTFFYRGLKKPELLKVKEKVELPINKTFSFIILNKDAPDFIIPLVESLINLNQHSNYDIIIGDTGSTNREVLDFYDKHSDKIKVVNGMKYHFSANYNHMIFNHSEAEVIGMINNDIVINDVEFLKDIKILLDQYDNSIVGSRLLYPNNTIQHGGVFFFKDGQLKNLPYHRCHGMQRDYLSIQGITKVPAVTGAFLFCKKDDYISLGGFDENYEEEAQDIDLCLKFRRAGGEIFFLNDYDIIHFENGTRPKGSENKHDRDYFLWKWSSFIEATITDNEMNNDVFIR